jgi:hypothetical protein
MAPSIFRLRESLYTQQALTMSARLDAQAGDADVPMHNAITVKQAPSPSRQGPLYLNRALGFATQFAFCTLRISQDRNAAAALPVNSVSKNQACRCITRAVSAERSMTAIAE